jgi:hypothetical protein
VALLSTSAGPVALLTILKEALQLNSHEQDVFDETVPLCHRTCEICTRTGNAELSGDGMATCLACGEEDFIDLLPLHD